MTVRKIISGCQTGADQGALAGAKAIGLLTGGMMPYGWRTDEGPRQDLCELYGLHMHASEKYPPRTKDNVRYSDGTLIFGNRTSPGCLLTIKYCVTFNRPFIPISWKSGQIFTDKEWNAILYAIRGWCEINQIETLNVAGNRERINPGIHDAAKQLIIETFKDRNNGQ